MKLSPTLLLGSLGALVVSATPVAENEMSSRAEVKIDGLVSISATVCNGKIGNCYNNGCNGNRQNLRCTAVRHPCIPFDPMTRHAIRCSRWARTNIE